VFLDDDVFARDSLRRKKERTGSLLTNLLRLLSFTARRSVDRRRIRSITAAPVPLCVEPIRAQGSSCALALVALRQHISRGSIKRRSLLRFAISTSQKVDLGQCMSRPSTQMVLSRIAPSQDTEDSSNARSSMTVCPEFDPPTRTATVARFSFAKKWATFPFLLSQTATNDYGNRHASLLIRIGDYARSVHCLSCAFCRISASLSTPFAALVDNSE